MTTNAEEYYKRQPESGALVNTNSEAYLIAKAKHNKALSDKQRLDALEEKYDTLLDINNQILAILKPEGKNGN